MTPSFEHLDSERHPARSTLSGRPSLSPAFAAFGYIIGLNTAVLVFFGGPIGDRFGRVAVIWVSIVGVLPFSLALPFVGFFWTVVLTGIIGFVMASSFPAIVVYAQELAPGRVGMIAGLFFGFAFGTGGLGAAALGVLADHTSLDFVYRICAILPAIGVLMLAMPKQDDAESY